MSHQFIHINWWWSYQDQSYAIFAFRLDRQSEIEFEQIELETENHKFPFKKINKISRNFCYNDVVKLKAD